MTNAFIGRKSLQISQPEKSKILVLLKSIKEAKMDLYLDIQCGQSHRLPESFYQLLVDTLVCQGTTTESEIVYVFDSKSSSLADFHLFLFIH